MALEDLTGPNKFITSLVNTNPLAADDRREGDDHIRGIKNVLLNTFPGVNKAIAFADYIRADGTVAMTAPLQLADGTSANPALAFASEPTLGFRRGAPGKVQLEGSLYTQSGGVHVNAAAGAPGGQDPALLTDATNLYLQTKAGNALVFAYATGALSYVNAANGRTIDLMDAGGHLRAPAGIFAGGTDFGFDFVSTSDRRLRFTTDNWRLGWESGSLVYRNNAGAALITVDGNGQTTAAANFAANGGNGVGLFASGYQSAGANTFVRYVWQCNPNWSEVWCMGIHESGNWAGLRFQANNGCVVDFKLSGGAGTAGTVVANLSGTASNASALNGRGGADFIHDNGTGNPEYIRNVGTTNLVCYINGAGEFNWAIGPSDARLKEDVQPSMVDSGAVIDALRFVEYRFGTFPPTEATPDGLAIDDGRLHSLGLIAQEARAALPDLVNSDGDWLSLNAQELAILALMECRALRGRMATLEALAAGV